MTKSSEVVNRTLEEYRAYLETLTLIQIDPRLRGKVRQSDMVQLTLVEAWNQLDELLALDSEARKHRLRRMLINNLLDKLREVTAACRDGRLERSLEEAATESACRLRKELEADDPSPLDQVVGKENEERLLEALSKLPPRQREALVLQKYQNWTLAQIAEHLKCTTAAVAGLHAHGLAKLRELLGDWE
jgi:RNA polymerase sigma-70 factor (subfamily 1)